MFDPNQIFDCYDNGIIVVDKNLNIVFWNQWMEDKSQISKSEAKSKSLSEILPNRISEKLIQVIHDSLENGTSFLLSDRFNKNAIKITLTPLSEEFIDTKVRVGRIKNSTNDVFCIIHIQDVTVSNARELYLVNQNRTIEEKTKELEHHNKMASLGRMASGIVHEINNPIAIIKGLDKSFEMVKRAQPLDEEKLNTIFSKIQSMADRIAHIIKGLKIIAHKDTYEFNQLVTIKSIIDESIELSRPKLEKSNVLIEVDDIPLSYEVWCDSIQLSQIIINLVSNAVDAIEDQVGPWIYINVRQIGKFYEIRIVDSGKGIPAQIAEHMFDPFFTSKKVGKGTGLGLSISQKIAEAHKGSLAIEHQATNTTFILKVIQAKYWG